MTTSNAIVGSFVRLLTCENWGRHENEIEKDEGECDNHRLLIGQLGLSVKQMVSCTRSASSSRTFSFLLSSRSLMHSSNKNRHSIQSALLDATIQLSVPTVTSAAPSDFKTRASSTLDPSVYSSARHLRRSISALSLSLPKRLDLPKRKSRRASPIGLPPSTISMRPPHHPCTDQSAALVDTNNNPTMISAVSSASEEYLSRRGSYRRSISGRSSPTRQHKSIKNALLGIWRGLNSDDLPSNASASLPVQYVDEPRVKKVRFKFPSRLVFDFHVFFASTEE